jgi:hypothetical protein
VGRWVSFSRTTSAHSLAKTEKSRKILVSAYGGDPFAEPNCLQIGHLINQWMVLSTTFAPLLQGKTTLRHRWRTMIAFLRYGRLRRATLDALTQWRFQVRFA